MATMFLFISVSVVSKYFSKLVSFYVGTGHRQLSRFLAQDLGDYM